jgi:hypothetical protein
MKHNDNLVQHVRLAYTIHRSKCIHKQYIIYFRIHVVCVVGYLTAIFRHQGCTASEGRMSDGLDKILVGNDRGLWRYYTGICLEGV